MSETHASLFLPDEPATQALAQRVAQSLKPGDVILLSGDVGAGKSTFARAVIQSLQETPEHVPSPTFTLVQTYDTRIGEIWHTDLYRLGDPDEILELGLADAMETAVCLVEWPDKLEHHRPATALELLFTYIPGAEGRHIQAVTDHAAHRHLTDAFHD